MDPPLDSRRLIKRTARLRRQAPADPAASTTALSSATAAPISDSAAPSSTVSSDVAASTTAIDAAGSSVVVVPSSTSDLSSAAPLPSSSDTGTDDLSSPTFGPSSSSSVLSTSTSTSLALTTSTDAAGVVVTLSSAVVVTLTIAGDAASPSTLSSSPTTMPASSSGSGLSSSARAGAIAGGVIGGVLLLLGALFLLFWILRRRRSSSEDGDEIRWPEMGNRDGAGVAGFVAPTRPTGRRGIGDDDDDEDEDPNNPFQGVPPALPSTRSVSPFQSTFYHSQPPSASSTGAGAGSAYWAANPNGPTRQPTYASTVSALSRSNTAPTGALPQLGAVTAPGRRSAEDSVTSTPRTDRGGSAAPTRPGTAMSSSAGHGGEGATRAPSVEGDPEDQQMVYSGADGVGGGQGGRKLSVVNKGEEEWDD
ncbi:hypothetical protein JCM8097_000651 [Rhodosporidiobolus ruineniae]